MIYFIGNEQKKIVKIGVADNNLQKRLKQLQTGCPYDLTVFKTVEGSYADEKKLHSMFSAHHIRGEWFSLSSEIKSFIHTGVFRERKSVYTHKNGIIEIKGKLLNRFRMLPSHYESILISFLSHYDSNFNTIDRKSIIAIISKETLLSTHTVNRSFFAFKKIGLFKYYEKHYISFSDGICINS